jgi:hypothetical protein
MVFTWSLDEIAEVCPGISVFRLPPDLFRARPPNGSRFLDTQRGACSIDGLSSGRALCSCSAASRYARRATMYGSTSLAIERGRLRMLHNLHGKELADALGGVTSIAAPWSAW